ALIRVASNIGTNADRIKDLRAYTSSAFFRTVRSAKIAAEKDAALLEPLQTHHLESRAVSTMSTVPPVEQQILVQELLQRLNGVDREIYLARLKGKSFKQIDGALSLKAGTSENRYREAKRRLAR
ncbi:MAG: hypothetical protein WA324_05010, partial [Bryobacteraceae bacterium]